MTTRPTQQQRILAILEAVRSGDHDIPDEYLRRHPSGDGISARYFKQVLLVSECNGRISELRGKGYQIETSVAKDRYGFAYHRLAPARYKRAEILAAAKEACEEFDRLPA
jgi:hypothetical protein